MGRGRTGQCESHPLRSDRESEAERLCSEQSGDPGCSPRAPSSRPARARCASVPPSVSRPSCALGWVRGAPGRGRPNSGSSTRRSCSKLGGNCKQAEGPAGTLSTLLTCQRRAGPRRPRGGAGGFMTRPPGARGGSVCPRPSAPHPKSHPGSGHFPLRAPVAPGKRTVIDSESRPTCRSPGSLTFEPQAQASPAHLTLPAATSRDAGAYNVP